MGQLYDEDWEHVDIKAFREAIIGNGVITGLEVMQSAAPAMTVLVSAGQCTIDGVVYSEASGQNLNIGNGDATHDRKDIIVYDATAGNPAVIAGTPAAAPIPPDIPAGDILLGIVLVEANEVTSILNADITEDRVYAIDRWAHTAVSANTTLNDAHYVIAVDASGGSRTITLPTSVGIKGKVYVIKKTDSTANVVIVDPNGAQTIDAAANVSLVAQWITVIIQSDGTNWIKIATEKANNEIRDAVEAATNSNTFTDTDLSKLSGIEASATTDQTPAEIRTAVEAATDSNTFTDDDHTKLNGVEAGATAIPVGVIMMWHGTISAIPSGYTLCNGSNGTPDLRSKFCRGAPDATEAGGTGGTDTHTLTINEMPAHAHECPASNDLGGAPSHFSGDNSGSYTLDTGSIGGGAAHNNMPAYYQILYIMKT